jgi:[ribosomal protein S5]-alanine N-acetyltransferase
MATSNVPDIETERLILRAPITADLPEWVARIWGDPDAMRYMPRNTTTPEESAQAVLNFFTGVRDRQQAGAWAITNKADGQFMGHCMLTYREAFHEHELGYALGQAFWGKGYATETARAVARYGFEQASLERIFAVVVPENTASWRVLEHLGFVYEKDVTHYNMPLAYYALRREQFVPGDAVYLLHDSTPNEDRKVSE